MACGAQGEFLHIVKRHLPQFFSGARVIEMGSLDINGSARGHFDRCRYVGVDVGAGPGVDRVMQGHLVDDPDGSYDCAISLNCFEHNPFWLETFTNMLRLAREGGLVLFTSASTGFREHGTRRSAPDASPLTVELGWDYYRNLDEQDFTRSIDLASWCSDWRFIRDHETYCIYFIGMRSDRGYLRLPAGLEPELRERFNPWRSPAAIKRMVKVALFGNFLSSPPSHYLRRLR